MGVQSQPMSHMQFVHLFNLPTRGFKTRTALLPERQLHTQLFSIVLPLRRTGAPLHDRVIVVVRVRTDCESTH
jgi:hypothetical protein